MCVCVCVIMCVCVCVIMCVYSVKQKATAARCVPPAVASSNSRANFICVKKPEQKQTRIMELFTWSLPPLLLSSSPLPPSSSPLLSSSPPLRSHSRQPDRISARVFSSRQHAGVLRLLRPSPPLCSCVSTPAPPPLPVSLYSIPEPGGSGGETDTAAPPGRRLRPLSVCRVAFKAEPRSRAQRADKERRDPERQETRGGAPLFTLQTRAAADPLGYAERPQISQELFFNRRRIQKEKETVPVHVQHVIASSCFLLLLDVRVNAS